MSNRSHYIVNVLTLLLITVALMPTDAKAVDPDPNDLTDAGRDYQVLDNIRPEQVRLVLNFQDAPVGEVLDYLSEVAGLVIISDSYLSGRVNLVSKQPLNIDEVVALLSTVLKEQIGRAHV